MRMRLEEVQQATGAAGDLPANGGAWVNGVASDSRLASEGDLFVCLRGEKLDGHAFAGDAVQRGAVAVLAEKPLSDVGEETPVLLVPDCLQALGDLAASWRERFRGTVIAVTGSAGKTSIKELLASILSLRGTTARSFKNWNNRLGVPLSILECSCEEDYWVLEAGVNLAGEMRDLARIISPDLALVNNIGPAHLEGLGGEEGVAREKACLISGVRQGGFAVVSADYPLLEAHLPQRSDLRWVRFSCREGEREIKGEYLGLQGERSLYRLDLEGCLIQIAPGLQGGYHLENILAAAVSAWILGCKAKEIQAGLERAELPEHRSKVFQQGGWRVIDDAYNSNPLSLRCSLQSARELSGGGPFFAFLGDMLELGNEAQEAHRKLGREAAVQGVETLFYKGEHASDAELGYREAGGSGRVREVDSVEEFLRLWRGLDASGGTVLFKASRGCHLERFAQALQQELQG